MALIKIVDCALHGGLTQDANACYEFKKWLQDNNIEYTMLFYVDDGQHQQVFNALNSWWQDANFNSFPIFVYTEMHDDLSPSQYPRKFFTSVADIKASDFLAQYALGR